MPAKISKITMVGFRGATLPAELSFDTSKFVSLIFGENGTGKSTIADAFDFVCNRSCGSLENYSLGEPAKKHVASLGFKTTEVKVALTCGPTTWTASLGKDGPIVSPPTGHPDVRILRRKRILDLIEEQPKKRYETLKSFIAVPGIEKSETTLRDALKTKESAYDQAVRALSQAKDELEKLWDAEGKPGKEAVQWAMKEADKDISQLKTNVIEIGKIQAAFQNMETALGLLDRGLAEQMAAEESLADAEAKQKDAEAKQVQQNTQLVKLLQDAKAYLTQKGPLSQCPVCEKSIDFVNIQRRLTERISEMQTLVSLAAATATVKRNADTKKSLADQARKDFCQNAKTLLLLLKSSNLAEVSALGINWGECEPLLSYKEASDALGQQARQLWKTVAPGRKRLQARMESDQKSMNQHNAIKGHVETVTQKAIDAKALEALVKKLKAALDIVSRQRKNYVEEVLASIAIEVETLYAKLHPGEGIGKIRFFLKPNAIGSLEFDAEFQSVSKLPPQAYYSESHLDTLGICVFLALSKRFRTENTLIILDDVLTSVDGPHLDRFMALLHDQAANFNQVIATTHYRPWRDRYRWSKGPMASTEVIELGPWTLKGGLQTGQFQTAVEELKAIISHSKFDRQVLSSKAGIVLESLLDFLTLKYRCAIPRNARNEYTLGDLAFGIDSRLGKELRSRRPETTAAGKADTPLKPLIDACTAEQWVRNSVGCHFTPLGSEVTDNEVRKFSQSVIALAGELICESCKMLPMRRPSGSYWQCKCGALELYPLIYPGADPRMVDDEA